MRKLCMLSPYLKTDVKEMSIISQLYLNRSTQTHTIWAEILAALGTHYISIFQTPHSWYLRHHLWLMPHPLQCHAALWWILEKLHLIGVLSTTLGSRQQRPDGFWLLAGAQINILKTLKSLIVYLTSRHRMTEFSLVLNISLCIHVLFLLSLQHEDFGWPDTGCLSCHHQIPADWLLYGTLYWFRYRYCQGKCYDFWSGRGEQLPEDVLSFAGQGDLTGRPGKKSSLRWI